jgi:O-antigen/teichoic acid export membrane protein
VSPPVIEPLPDGVSRATSNPTSAPRHIRGSAIVLLGRGLALLINFLGQVLVVRYLSKADFGAFAFATSMVAGVSTLLVLGLDKSLARFTAIHQEERDYGRMLGTILLSLAAVSLSGFAVVAGVLVLWLTVGFPFASNELAARLLLLLMLVAPFHALDGLLLALFGVFSSPIAILVRRHLLGPGLKLLVIGVVIAYGGGVYWLTLGQMAGQVFGVLVGLGLLWGILRRQALLDRFCFNGFTCSSRELFRYSLPVVTSDLMMVFRVALVVFLLEWLRGSAEVAELRAVFPLARLNESVMTTFTLMFVPTVSRMFARQEGELIDKVYWQTAAWMMALCFPLFLVCFVFATPISGWLFGSAYRSAGPVLALLSLGCFLHAAFGFNAQTLRIHGYGNLVALIDVLSLVIGLLGNFVLIPAYGTWGAAVATTLALLFQNLANHVGMVRLTNVSFFNRAYTRPYLVAVAGWGCLTAVQSWFQLPLAVGLVLAALVSGSVFYLGRRALEIASTLPELTRVPLIGRAFN